MKIAKVEDSKTGAYLQPDGSYLFGEASNRQYGKQCGGSTNDWLGFYGEQNWMSSSPKSKIDGPDYKTIDKATPINGGYFVMDIGAYWHVGVINKVVQDGVFLTDYNRNNREKRRENLFVKKGSSEWKNIHGFGVGNPIVNYDQPVDIDPVVEKTIIPQNSALWNLIDDLQGDKRIPEEEAIICKNLYHKLNETLRGL